MKHYTDACRAVCRCPGSDFSSALLEQPEECLKCLRAAAYEASPVTIHDQHCCRLPSAVLCCSTAHRLSEEVHASQDSKQLHLPQALFGVHKARTFQALGRRLQEQAINVQIFNYKASLLSIAGMKSSCIGEPSQSLPCARVRNSVCLFFH